MLQLEGRESTREDIRTYQAEKLGRFGGKTLLTELMPIPKPKVHRWDYEYLIPQFASRRDYYETVKPRRIEYLSELIETHRPKVVICYSKAFWDEFKALFDGYIFSQNGQFQTAVPGQTLVILTGHFTARSMNGRFDNVVVIVREQHGKSERL